MYWLEDHLEEGSFKSCYADTDSMALALTRSGPEIEDPEASLRSLFDPLVKPSKKASWESSWKSWFVTTDEIWDIRKPGKLKGNGPEISDILNILAILNILDAVRAFRTLSKMFKIIICPDVPNILFQLSSSFVAVAFVHCRRRPIMQSMLITTKSSLA